MIKRRVGICIRCLFFFARPCFSYTVSCIDFSCYIALKIEKIWNLRENNMHLQKVVCKVNSNLFLLFVFFFSSPASFSLWFSHYLLGCLQGIKQPEYFGFICREKSSSVNYMCYVFKCQSESVVSFLFFSRVQMMNNSERIG